MTVQKMKGYLLDLKQRQVHVAGLNKKIGESKNLIQKIGIFIYNLDELIQYFSRFGEIRSVTMATHYKTERLLGFATVEFKSKSGVQNTMQVHEHVIQGKVITCTEHLLKAELNEIRPYEKSKYGAKIQSEETKNQ